MVNITKDMTFEEVITKYPNSVHIFLKHGLTCVGCPFASQETIEQGAEGHGVPIGELLKDLNQCLKEKK